MLEELTARLPSFQLVGGPGVRLLGQHDFRAPASVHVRWPVLDLRGLRRGRARWAARRRASARCCRPGSRSRRFRRQGGPARPRARSAPPTPRSALTSRSPCARARPPRTAPTPPGRPARHLPVDLGRGRGRRARARCRASHGHRARAGLPRRQRGSTSAEMAVVVQRMFPARAAGVAMTLEPFQRRPLEDRRRGGSGGGGGRRQRHGHARPLPRRQGHARTWSSTQRRGGRHPVPQRRRGASAVAEARQARRAPTTGARRTSSGRSRRGRGLPAPEPARDGLVQQARARCTSYMTGLGSLVNTLINPLAQRRTSGVDADH